MTINNPDQYIEKIQQYCEVELPIAIKIEFEVVGNEALFSYEIKDSQLGFLISHDSKIKSFIEALRSIALDLSNLNKEAE